MATYAASPHAFGYMQQTSLLPSLDWKFQQVVQSGEKSMSRKQKQNLQGRPKTPDTNCSTGPKCQKITANIHKHIGPNLSFV